MHAVWARKKSRGLIKISFTYNCHTHTMKLKGFCQRICIHNSNYVSTRYVFKCTLNVIMHEIRIFQRHQIFQFDVKCVKLQFISPFEQVVIFIQIIASFNMCQAWFIELQNMICNAKYQHISHKIDYTGRYYVCHIYLKIYN